MEKRAGQTILQLIEGDITSLDHDAIVNAANEHLRHGGGVAGAIVRRGGRIIQDESDAWVAAHGPVTVGTAAITTGGSLPASHVIHVVGPRMGEGDEDRKLRAATRAALSMADAHGLKSVALPAISTGIFGYPVDRCARIMLHAAAEYAGGETGLERVVFCLFGEEALAAFTRVFDEL